MAHEYDVATLGKPAIVDALAPVDDKFLRPTTSQRA